MIQLSQNRDLLSQISQVFLRFSVLANELHGHLAWQPPYQRTISIELKEYTSSHRLPSALSPPFEHAAKRTLADALEAMIILHNVFTPK